MPYIIAEIGFNHEGEMDAAEEMIRAAARAGADAVKFQTFRALDLALPSAPHYAAIKAGELNLEQHLRLKSVADEVGIEFLSTPFSRWAVDLLERVGVAAYKVASMDCTNRYLLGRIAETGKPLYLSTGMASLAEIGDTLEYLAGAGAGPVTILHCLSLYPARAEDLNLNAIPMLKDLFGVRVGYSDHYPGAKACLAAALLGAEVIETHFTLNTAREGGDHHHSVDSAMLAQLIADIDELGRMLGRDRAIHDRMDRRLKDEYRRGVYAARDIAAGRIIGEEDLLFCRPAGELSPNDVGEVVGRPAARDIAAYEELTRRDIG